jgi:ankyrin repeat protein
VEAMTFDEVSRAITKGDVLNLRRYLESGMDPNLTHRFSTPILQVAALSGNTTAGRMLIEQGAALDVRTRHGWTALAYAIHSGHVSFVKLLLDSGASLDFYPFGSSVESFLDWESLYSRTSAAQLKRIAAMIEAARQSRQSTPTI